MFHRPLYRSSINLHRRASTTRPNKEGVNPTPSAQHRRPIWEIGFSVIVNNKLYP